MTEQANRPAEVLLVEDNEGDIRLTQEAFREIEIVNGLHVTRDGEDALRYLRKEPPYAEALRPDLILLDLNLPRKDGREVLKELKEDRELKRIPVVVLTTSKSVEDVWRSYDLHANSYITKPLEFADFMEVVRQIESFWLSLVRLPDH